MRKLLWFSVGFALACAAGMYLLQGKGYWLIAAFCLLGMTVLLCTQKKTCKIMAVSLLGCAIGFAWMLCFDSIYLSPVREMDMQTIALTIEASDFGVETTYGETVDGTIRLDNKQYTVHCYLREHYGIEPGDAIEGIFSLRYTAKGGQLNETYYQNKGVFLLAYAKDAVKVQHRESMGLRSYLSLWRNKILLTIERLFPEDTAAVAKALLLGDTADLSFEQNRNLQISGIRHIVAVSGLHVSVLMSMIYLLCYNRRYATLFLGVPVLFLFAAIAGFTPSIMRACIMQGLMVLSIAADKEYDPPTALSFAALVLLLINPIAIKDVGFQLSVGCMIGIFSFQEKLHNWFLSIGNLKEKSKGRSVRAKIIRWTVSSSSVSLSAMVFTVPLCAVYFNVVSLVSVITNYLTLWIVSTIFCGIVFACVLGIFCQSAGAFLAVVISWPIRFLLGVSAFFAKIPMAAIYMDNVYIRIWLIMAYGLLLTFVITKKKYPLFTTAAVAALLCVCLTFSWLENKKYEMQVSIIDVGQGQSVLLSNGSERYLIDCGSISPKYAAESVINYLMSKGIRRLDGIVLTHYDVDHAGGVPYLLSYINADRVYLPDSEDSNGIRDAIESAAGDRAVSVRENTTLALMDAQIKLYPALDWSTDNESSMCILFQKENYDILITGDRTVAGEKQLLEQVRLPKIEVLVVGHHGSESATSHELLMASQPDFAVISVGEGNHYGHPGSATIDRLSLYNCRVLRTDQNGTIEFRR